jgi:CheY-like chemotaxis protein
VVLVADDDAAVRTLVASILNMHGHAVLAAADGREALELARRHNGRIDLVITDLEMPRMNGIDLCARLLEERPEMKALMMSGSQPNVLRDKHHHVPFMPKPLDVMALGAKVTAILTDSQ